MNIKFNKSSMPTFQIIEQVPAIRYRALVVVCENQNEVVELYNKGSYIEESEWYEVDEGTIDISTIKLTPN